MVSRVFFAIMSFSYPVKSSLGNEKSYVRTTCLKIFSPYVYSSLAWYSSASIFWTRLGLTRISWFKKDINSKSWAASEFTSITTAFESFYKSPSSNFDSNESLGNFCLPLSTWGFIVCFVLLSGIYELRLASSFSSSGRFISGLQWTKPSSSSSLSSCNTLFLTGASFVSSTCGKPSSSYSFFSSVAVLYDSD